jgi:hypothetical protein
MRRITTAITTRGDARSPHRLLVSTHASNGSGKERMNERSRSDATRHEAGRYEIRLLGHLDPRWSAWFDGLTLSREPDGTTVIHGDIADQAALHGLLQRVRDIGMPLLSVSLAEPDQAVPPTTDAR